MKSKLRKVKFRIDLDIEDAFADGEKLLGEAVNFVSRPESFAQPSGKTISKHFLQSLEKS